MEQPELFPVENPPATPYEWLAKGAIKSITQRAAVLKIELTAESMPGLSRGSPDVLGVTVALQSRGNRRLVRLGVKELHTAISGDMKEPSRAEDLSGWMRWSKDHAARATRAVVGPHGLHLLDSMLWAICPSHVPARMDVTLALASYWVLRFTDGRTVKVDHRDELEAIGDEEVKAWSLGLHDLHVGCPQDLPLLAPYTE